MRETTEGTEGTEVAIALSGFLNHEGYEEHEGEAGVIGSARALRDLHTFVVDSILGRRTGDRPFIHHSSLRLCDSARDPSDGISVAE